MPQNRRFLGVASPRKSGARGSGAVGRARVGVWKRRSGGAWGMPRATPSSIFGALAPVGGPRWAGEVGARVDGTHFAEKSGSPKIAQKWTKRRKKVAGRQKWMSVGVFLGSMDPGLSFDVYYSLRDPLVAALEFLENRKIWRKWVENRSVGGAWWDWGWWTENRFFAISCDWG